MFDKLTAVDVKRGNSTFNLDRSLIITEQTVNGTFQARVNGHRYNLTYFEAERLCQVLGASLASLDQLKAAWQAGMQLCRYLTSPFKKTVCI